MDSDEEPCYDSGRYYRTGSVGRERESQSVFDSPASPDNVHNLVTGSPLKIIPRSPTRDETGDAERAVTEDEEDLDEDLLYLRLIALRSLAEENNTNETGDDNSEDTDNKLADEMKELLEEAEVAAQESGDAGDTGTTHRISLV